MFVSPGASILHADLDAFFASVEQRDDRRLRGRPVLVGMGVVLAASYEAKAFGIRTAMSERKARQLCPHAVAVRPRFSAYVEASKAVFEVFENTTPLVEGLSIDEAFLDVRGMERAFGTPVEIAERLRCEVADRVGLPITVGVARTKFLAKVASAVAKPDGLLVVPPEQELAFLHPLPVERLWGVGPVTAAKLRERGITKVRQVALLPEQVLVSMLGRASGRQLHALAHNLDPRPVHARRRRGSIGSQRARGRGPHAPADVDADVVALVDRVTRRLRAARRVGRTVVLRLRFDDYTRATRSHTLPHATAHTDTILAAARGLLAAATPLIERRGLTLVGVAVANLENDDAVQLPLPFRRRDEPLLDAALDEVRDRFGSAAVTRAVLRRPRPRLHDADAARLAQLGQQLLHPADLDQLVGVDVARKRVDLGLDAAVGGIELVHHLYRAAVVLDHEAEEEPIERFPLRPLQPLHLRLRQHARHQLLPDAVRMAVGAVELRRALAAGLEPGPHLLDLRLLRDVDPFRKQCQLGPVAARRHEHGHPERLRVVVDHPLDELHVLVGVAGRFDLGELLGRQRLRRFAGRARLHDVRCGLADQRLRIVVPATAGERNGREERR